MYQKTDVMSKSNFNLFSQTNSLNCTHEYNYNNYIIITDIIDDKLSITIQNKSSDLNSDTPKYLKLYTQEELVEINRVFMMYDKIEDCVNLIDVNNKNILLSIEKNCCILTIKLDTKELPKNKISDTIILTIPIYIEEPQKEKEKENKNNNILNNSNISQINNNLKSLNIEQI